jgi:nucleoside 2-deoxyribosyltransferase
MAKSKKVGVARASSGPSKKTSRPYPNKTLEEALKIPQAIRDKNNGNPWAVEDVAQAAYGLKPTNNRFFYLAAAARDYGLTIGTRYTERIELAPLGREIVFAGDEGTKQQKLIESFFSVDVFKRVYEHYGSANLPEKEFLSNTLQSEFGLASEFLDEFTDIFKANCKFLGIDQGVRPGLTVPSTTNVEHPSDIRVVGEPKGKFDRTAFVIMPFVEKGHESRSTGFFQEVLRSLITPAGNNAGFAVETAAQAGSDVIQSTIINQLLTADLVVADLTDHNPNVLFELGIRLAKELPVAIIKAEGTGPIFDVDNMMRVLTYSPNLWATTVASDVPRMKDHIKAAWDNRTTAKNYMQILTGRTV